MAEKKGLFRKVALQRLSSPEQLDQILQVTTPRAWISLLTMAGLIATALAWGIFGSVPSRVSGMGIFIRGQGIRDISAPAAGQITEMYVSPGDKIFRGQIVARIAQTHLITRISQIRERIHELTTEKKMLEEYHTRQLALQTDFDKKRTALLNSEIETITNRIQWLLKRKDEQQQLVRKGLITRQKYLTTLEDLDHSRQQVLKLKNDLQQIPMEFLRLTEQQKQKLRNMDMQIREMNRELEKLEQTLEGSSRVLSAHNGRILEVTAGEGSLIRPGARIASLEPADDTLSDLQVVIYVPAAQGAEIKAGMKAQISPGTVKAEEYGVMLGIVTHVGEFPATREGMMRILRNNRLVNQFSGQGAPLEICISPIPSPDTFSGYQWSSSLGPKQRIHSGTLASGTVTVRKQAPITLVIPWLKKNILGLGSDEQVEK